jgi:hypothetical protein
MCQLATVSRSQVDNSVLHFDSIIDDILNGRFRTILPATFKKVNGNPNIVVTSGDDDSKIEGNKCRKKNQESGNIVKNTEQLKESRWQVENHGTKISDPNVPKNAPTSAKTAKCAHDGTSKSKVIASIPALAPSAMSQEARSRQSRKKLSLAS